MSLQKCISKKRGAEPWPKNDKQDLSKCIFDHEPFCFCKKRLLELEGLT